MVNKNLLKFLCIMILLITSVSFASAVEPVSYWNFEENTGTTLEDQIGSNDGTITGMTWSGSYPSFNDSGSGKYYSGSFDGTNDYVSIPDSDDLSFTNEIFSMSYWFKSTHPDPEVFFNKGGGANDREYYMEYGTSSLKFRMYNNGQSTTYDQLDFTDDFDNGNWYNIIITGDGTNIKGYVNGVLEDTTLITIGMSNLVSTLNIGRYSGGSLYWAGQMDELKIFNSSLNSTEITNLYKTGRTTNTTIPTDNIVAYLPLNDEQGDFDVNGATGTEGILNGAMSFDGTDDYIDSSSYYDIPNSLYYSVGGWYKATTSTSRGILLSFSSTTGTYSFLSLQVERSVLNVNDPGYVLFNQRDDGLTLMAISADGEIDDGEYHLIYGVRDGDSFKLYIDGSLATSTTTTDIGTTTSNSMMTGAGYFGSATPQIYTNGLIDEVKMFNKSLSTTEISELYNAGVPEINTVAESDQVFYSSMDSIYDFSENTNSGTGLNGVSYDASSNAYDFDGTDDKVVVNTTVINNYLKGKKQIAISTWINRDNINEQNTIFYSRTDSDNAGLQFQLKEDNTLFLGGRGIVSGSFVGIAGTKTISNDGWHHVVGIWDYENNKGYTYIDNIIDLNETINWGSNTLNFDALYTNIGTLADGYYFDGKMSDIIIYNSSLNSTEVSDIYSTGRSVNPYFETSGNTPPVIEEPVYSNEDAFCNYSGVGDFDYSWYVNDSEVFNGYCYQESATVDNQTGIDGDCNLDYSGTIGADDTEKFIYINYTIPEQSSGAKWLIKYGKQNAPTTSNFTIYDSCLNGDILQLKMQVNGSNSFNCYNGSSWVNVSSVILGTTSYGSVDKGVPVYTYDGNWGTHTFWSTASGGWNKWLSSNGYYINIFEEAIYWNFNITDTLPTSYFDVEDNLTCEVNDVNSTQITVLNTPPVIDTVQMNNTPVLSNESIIGFCNATDYDGDTLTFDYDWFVNDVEVSVFEHNDWVSNSSLISALGDVGYKSAPSVFYDDGTLKLISGDSDGTFTGFQWSGSAWVSNSSIVSGLTDVGGVSSPSVFYDDEIWKLIAGEFHGGFNGFQWSGLTWVSNSSIVSGLTDVGYNSYPVVFNDSGTLKLISGDSDGTFTGFQWSGSAWVSNSSIVSGLTDVGYDSSPEVFNDAGTWKLISGEQDGVFNGFQWNGTSWVSNTSIVSGLTDVGQLSSPSVFYDDGWKLISGANFGEFIGFQMPVFSTINLSVEYFDKNDNVTLQCIANDGTSDSAAVNSSETTILNTPPVIDTVQMNNTPVYTNKTIIGFCNATDFDVDPLTYSYDWFVNDVSTGITATTLVPANFEQDDVIILQCIVNDGTSDSPALNSSETTILNTPPVVDNLLIVGQYPENNVTGYCNVSDYDNDNLNTTFEWYVESVSVYNYSTGFVVPGQYTSILDSSYGVVGDNVTLKCKTTDDTTSSSYSQDELILENHGILSSSNFSTDETSETPQIYETITFEGYVTGYNTLDTCTLQLIPEPNGTIFDSITTTITPEALTNKITSSFAITADYRVPNNNVTWRLLCNDTSGNYALTINDTFTVKDITPPYINVTNSTLMINGTILDNYQNDTYLLNIPFSDLNLFQASVNITCDDYGQFYYWEILDINTTTYNFSEQINFSEVGIDSCDIVTSVSDDHTAETIPNYEVTETDNTITYTTENGLTVEIISDSPSTSTNTKKLDDRYNFEFDYAEQKLLRKYTIKSDGTIFYRTGSNYPAHFVTWNKETHTGNWIDFALPHLEDFIYIVNEITPNEYEVIIAHKVLAEPENEEAFNAIEKTGIFESLIDFVTPEKALDPESIKDKTEIKTDKGTELGTKEIADIINIKVKDTKKLEDLEKTFGTTSVAFNSIGGTNIFNISRYFFMGGSFNLTSHNDFDDTTFMDYSVSITKAGDTTYAYSNTYPASAQNDVTNQSAGTYTLTMTHPEYVTKTYTEVMETQYDLCIQDNANVTVACGAAVAGAYAFSDATDINNVENMFDSNTATYATITSLDFTEIYMNYTVPTGATYASWLVTAFGDSGDTTILLDTNTSILQLRIRAKAGEAVANILLQAYNGTAWTNLSYTPLQVYNSQIFDEQITWFTQIDNVIDVIYNTSQALITFNMYDIKSRESIEDYTLYINDTSTGIVTTHVVTDAIAGYTIPLNAEIAYNISFVQAPYFNMSEVHTFDFKDVKTVNMYVPYYSALTIYDEGTLELFDFGNPIESKLLIICDGETKTIELTHEVAINATHNETVAIDTIPIECEYTAFKFSLTYVADSGALNIYRHLIVPYADSFNITAYLLDTTGSYNFVYSAIILDDLMGRYENASVWIYKQIENGTVLIASYYTDIEDKVGAYLIENNNYIIEVHSSNNPDRIIGDYQADVGEDKVISLYDINLDASGTSFYQDVTTSMHIINDSTTGIANAIFYYSDPNNQTETLQMTIRENTVNGAIIYESPVYDWASYKEVQVPLVGYSEQTLIASMIITNEEIGDRNVSAVLNRDWKIRLPLIDDIEQETLNWMFIILISMVALMASFSANKVSLVVAGIAFVFAIFGWMTVSLGVVAIAAIVAILDMVMKTKR